MDWTPGRQQDVIHQSLIPASNNTSTTATNDKPVFCTRASAECKGALPAHKTPDLQRRSQVRQDAMKERRGKHSQGGNHTTNQPTNPLTTNQPTQSHNQPTNQPTHNQPTHSQPDSNQDSPSHNQPTHSQPDSNQDSPSHTKLTEPTKFSNNSTTDVQFHNTLTC